MKNEGNGCDLADAVNAFLATPRNRRLQPRRPSVVDKKKAKIAASLYADGKSSIQEICDTLEISRATFYRHIRTKEPSNR